MKKPKKDKRSKAAVKKAAIACMRRSFARYSPLHKEVLERCRVEAPRYKKDGSISKQIQVDYKCESCGDLVKTLDVDHKEPVIPVHLSDEDLDMQQIFDRINCDISNLWGICVDKCHTEKSNIEKKQRAYHRKLRKGK